MGMPKQRQEPEQESSNRRDEIAEALRARIARGEFVPGALIPSSRAVAREYGCAPMTAQAAIRILAEEGTITTRNRQGSIVTIANRSVAGPAERMRRSTVDGALYRQGDVAEILSACLREATENPDAAAVFGIADHDVMGVREYVVRDSAGVAITYGRSYIPANAWNAVAELRERAPIQDGAIGAIRRVLGLETVAVPTRRTALEATEEEAAVLGVEAGSPVLVEVTECQLADGTTVEYAVYVHPRGYWVGR
jgi:GntR family transcriptional regulator